MSTDEAAQTNGEEEEEGEEEDEGPGSIPFYVKQELSIGSCLLAECDFFHMSSSQASV